MALNRGFAVFPRGIDGLFLRPTARTQVYLLVEEGRPEQRWAQRFAADRLIPYRLRGPTPLQERATAEVLAQSDIASGLARHAVSRLFLHSSRSTDIEHWARRERVRLVAVSARFARDLEHKIHFDRFLAAHRIAKPASLSGPAGTLDPLPFARGSVAQKPDSMGGEGTYFLAPGARLESLVASGVFAPDEPCLVRERVHGEALGITLLVGHAVCALSSVRRQCYYPSPEGAVQAQFAGVQWLPHQQLSERRIARVEAVFGRLLRVLHATGFRGFANVDFLITRDDDVRVIECNPRPSAATPCLFAWPALIHDLPVAELFLDAVGTRPKRALRRRFYGLPASDFAGSVLDIPANVRDARPRRVRRSIESGVYRDGRAGFAFVAADPAALGPRGSLFAFSSVKVGERYSADATLVNVCSSLPLFGARGQINARGRRVLRTFEVT